MPTPRASRNPLLTAARFTFALASFFFTGTTPAADPAGVPPKASMSWLDNGTLRLGIDLHRGGSIVFLSRNGGPNLINSHDFGRQVQMSFYSGPVPFTSNGQQPARHWEHLGWNPVQTGDDFHNTSTILAHENSGRALHVKTRPLQWPLNNIPGECTFESWLALDGFTVTARARLVNSRSDHQQYPGRHQELPAVYSNAPWHRVVTYSGNQPFTAAPVTNAPSPKNPAPWAYWLGTEGWSALLNPDNSGLGLVTPGRIDFIGGFSGTPGPPDPLSASTGYLASLSTEILDHNITFDYHYELVAGSLDEIRARAARHQPKHPPSWTFSKNRQGWHLRNASDQGWPVSGLLDIRPTGPNPQLVSPFSFWNAAAAQILIIEAAFSSSNQNASISWQRHGQSAPNPEDQLSFPIKGDGSWQRYTIRLHESPAWSGPIVRLLINPALSPNSSDHLRIKSVRLTSSETPTPQR